MTSVTVDADTQKLRAALRDRLATRKAPFHQVDVAAAQQAIERLIPGDDDLWARVWTAAAEPFEDRARACAAGGDAEGAKTAYMFAYALYHVGRFPSPTCAAKMTCYRRSVACYRAAGAYFDPPLEVVEVPFQGRPDEGNTVTFYVRRRPASKPQPVIVRWGGIDTWKEERHEYNEAALERGFVQINIDMPGVGEAPVVGSLDAERMFLPLLDWIAREPLLDETNVVLLGMSYGGYWSTKLAHRFPERFAGVVNWGGGVDEFFSREWNQRSINAPSYLMDLGAARARTVGKGLYEEYIAAVSEFSLLKQGLLDHAHSPMLLVNGRHDEQIPFDDMLVLLEHGQPKAARFFPGGHMGYGPQTFPTVLSWMTAAVSRG